MKKLGFILLAISLNCLSHAADFPDTENLSDYCKELTAITDINDPTSDINTLPQAHTPIDQKLLDYYANTPERGSTILRPMPDGHLADNHISNNPPNTPTEQWSTCVNLEKPPACLTRYMFSEREEIARAAHQAALQTLKASANQEEAKEIIQKITAEYPAFSLAITSGCFNEDNRHATKQWLKLEDVTLLHYLGIMLRQITNKRKRCFFTTRKKEEQYALTQLKMYCENSPLFAQAYKNKFFTRENVPLLQRLIDGDIHSITLKRPSIRAQRKEDDKKQPKKMRVLKLKGSKDKKRAQLRRARSTDMGDITNENEPQA